MKVKTIRQSGNPVSIEDYLEFRKEFEARYDTLYDQYKTDKNMESFNTELTKLDAKLAKKYDTIVEWELPKSGSSWKKLLEKAGAPLQVNVHAETGEVFLTLIDMEV